MTISSRTPEGLPSECPVCGAATNLEYSLPGEDAPCPGCGCLLWKSQAILDRLSARFGQLTETTADRPSRVTLLAEVGSDSLETVELVMELEEEFDISIPDEVAESLTTVGDLIRFLQGRWDR